MLTTLLAATALSDLGTFEVKSIDRTSVFAGKRGQRITESWVVTSGNREITVRISPYHTKTADRPKLVKAGDRVMFTVSAQATSVSKAISEIRR